MLQEHVPEINLLIVGRRNGRTTVKLLLPPLRLCNPILNLTHSSQSAKKFLALSISIITAYPCCGESIGIWEGHSWS